MVVAVVSHRRPDVETVRNLRCKECAAMQGRMFYDPATVELRCSPNRVPNTGPVVARLEFTCQKCGRTTAHYVQEAEAGPAY